MVRKLTVIVNVACILPQEVFQKYVCLQSVVWVVRFNAELRAFSIGLTEKGLCFVNEKCFRKISEMVSHYVRTRKPLHKALPIVVKRPVPHPVSFLLSIIFISERTSVGSAVIERDSPMCEIHTPFFKIFRRFN